MYALHRRAILSCASALALAAAAAPTVHAQPIHEVASGESLWQVAAANGMSPAALAAANGLSADAGVRAGQVLSIPPRGAAVAPTAPTAGTAPNPVATTATPAAPAASSGAAAGGYLVRTGDTLSAIAARQGVSVAQLAASNGLTIGAILPAGRALSLPAGGGSGSTATAAPATAAPTTATAATTTPARTAPAAASTPVASAGRVSGDQIAAIAARNGVPTSLAQAIAWQESGFDNGAVSSVGARGVMQVMPGTWSWIGSNLAGRTLDPNSATDNVEAGTLYLGHLLRETGGDQAQAAAGYYQGLGSVRSRGRYDDTERYVRNVEALRSRFGG